MDACRAPRFAGLLLVVVLAVSASASAGWSVPEAKAYPADQRVLVDDAADRWDLTYASGLLAWSQHSWNQTGTRTAHVGLVSLPPAANQTHRVFEDQQADAPTIGPSHVAWRTFPGDYSRLGDDAMLQVLERATNETRTVSVDGDRLSHPLLVGQTLYWAVNDLASRQPQQITALDLATGERTTWTSPVGGNVYELGWSPPYLLLDTENPNRLHAWIPGTNTTRTLVHDPIVWEASSPFIVSTEYREDDGGRGASLYLTNTASGHDQRVTFSPGREHGGSLSHPWLVWADTRSDSDARQTPVLYDLYLQHVPTRTEYKIQGTSGISSAPKLVDQRVYVNDEHGHLVEIDLATIGPLPQASPQAHLTQQGNQTLLNVTLNTTSNATTAWDTDHDGTFETPGNLTIANPQNHPNTTPGADEIQGLTLEHDGRHAVVTVSIQSLYQHAQTQPQTPERPPENQDTHPPGSASNPIPAAPLLTLVAALSLAALAHRLQPRS